jgi:hypothetical protein
MKSHNKKLIVAQLALGACSLMSLEASAAVSYANFYGVKTYASVNTGTNSAATGWNYVNDGSYLAGGQPPFSAGSVGTPDGSQAFSTAYAEQPGQPNQKANASASVDLTTGSLHVSVDGVNYAGGLGMAAFRDKVTFHSVNQTTTIGVQYTIDGFFTLTGPNLTYAHHQISLESNLFLTGPNSLGLHPVANAYLGVDSPIDQPTLWWGGVSGAPSTVVDMNVDTRYSITKDASGRDIYTYTDYFTYSGTDPYAVDLYMDLSLNCSYNVTCDFGNTAKIGFILPEGVSFESQSQHLLTSVPVPTAVWLFGSGLLGLLGLGRQRKAV